MSITPWAFKMEIPGKIGTNSSSDQWKQDLERQLSKVPPSLTYGSKVAVSLEAFIDKKRINGNRLDCDNLAKPVLDAMKKAHIIHDDSLVYDLHVTKHATGFLEHLEITVSEWLS